MAPASSSHQSNPGNDVAFSPSVRLPSSLRPLFSPVGDDVYGIQLRLNKPVRAARGVVLLRGGGGRVRNTESLKKKKRSGGGRRRLGMKNACEYGCEGRDRDKERSAAAAPSDLFGTRAVAVVVLRRLLLSEGCMRAVFPGAFSVRVSQGDVDFNSRLPRISTYHGLGITNSPLFWQRLLQQRQQRKCRPHTGYEQAPSTPALLWHAACCCCCFFLRRLDKCLDDLITEEYLQCTLEALGCSVSDMPCYERECSATSEPLRVFSRTQKGPCCARTVATPLFVRLGIAFFPRKYRGFLYAGGFAGIIERGREKMRVQLRRLSSPLGFIESAPSVVAGLPWWLDRLTCCTTTFRAFQCPSCLSLVR